MTMTIARSAYPIVLASFVMLLLGAGCGSAPAYPAASQSRSMASEGYAAEAPMAGAVQADEDVYVTSSDNAPVAERETVAQAAGSPARPPAEPPPPPKQRPDVPTGAPQPAPPVAPGTDTAAKSPTSPLLIYTAQVNLAVFETAKVLDQVEALAKASGGYLVRREARRIVVRVPSEGFDDALAKVQKLGDVLHKDVTVQDVTEEFHDLQIRIRNLEVVRNRLEELLKKADKVVDAIAVERELERVTSQLERLKGRIKLLGELVRFSTITVELAPRSTDSPGRKVQLPFPWLDTLGLGRLLSL